MKTFLRGKKHPSGEDVEIEHVSGFKPVTLFLISNPVNIHAVGDYHFSWHTMKNNPWTYTTLSEAPEGLGLNFDIDGDSTIETAEEGTWAFTLAVSFPGDSTWSGLIELDTNTHNLVGAIGDQNNPRYPLSETVKYPAGALFYPRVQTQGPSAANPLNASGLLTIVRLN